MPDDIPIEPDLETAVFGGGCFWCTEAVFLEVIGVESVVSGYAGGHTENPTYEQVCSGRTGHAEVTKITFERAAVSYRDMLDVFFATHDPTTLNRQGADVGTQYRSIIFYANDDQREAAEETIRELDESGELPGPVVTQLEPLGRFYEAEGYHQDYYKNNPYNPYCTFVISPKLSKFRSKFAVQLR